MAHVAFDRVDCPTGLDRFPIRLEQSTSRTSTLARILLLAPALIAVGVPLALLGAHAMAEPGTLALLGEHPLTTLQIAAGIALWMGLFALPLQRLVARASHTRVVDITGERVSVIEGGRWHRRVWTAPLSSYRGIAQHVRSSLSGTRHELVLVHAEPGRHVLLAVTDRMPPTLPERTAALLQLPEIPAGELYRRRLGRFF